MRVVDWLLVKLFFLAQDINYWLQGKIVQEETR